MTGKGISRGTTPTCTFNLPFETDTIAELWVVFSQRGREIFTKDKSDCTLEGKTITLHLAQTDTLSLSAFSNIEIQLSVLFDNGERANSNPIECNVDKVLKEGVMGSE